MFFSTTAYAEDSTSAPSTSAIDLIQNNFMSFLPMLMIFGVFYFLLIRPQEKKRKEQENLIDSVKRGETIVTNAGIYGMVEKVHEADASVDLQVAKDVVIKISKSSIADIISRKKDSK